MLRAITSECTRAKDDRGLWGDTDFLKLWAGQTVSVFGSLLSRTAIPFTAALTLHATPGQMALLGAADTAPTLCVGLFAGAWVDRVRRRPLLIAADILRALVLCVIPLAAWRGALRMEHLLVAGLLTGVLNTIFDVAYGAYLPTLIGTERIAEGNAKLSASGSVAEFAAFSASGWLVQWFGGPVAVGIDALTFLVSAVSLGCVRRKELPRRPETPTTASNSASGIGQILSEIRDGLRIVAQNRLLFPLALGNALLSLSGGVFGTLIILFITQTLRVPTGVQGMIFAIGGITSLLGALAAGPVTRALGLGNTLAGSLLIAAIGMLFVPLAPGPTLAGITLLALNQIVCDPAWTIFEINQTSLRQGLVADAVRGRVEATFRFAAVAARFIGLGAAAYLGERLGLRTALLLGCAGMGSGAVLLALSPVRPLRTQPVPDGSDAA
jgi:MFS family permease